jgi:cytochrome c oxidase subunit 4
MNPEGTLEQAHPEPNYMAVFYWLLALTIIEVIVVYAHLPKICMVVALVLLALSKAFLVAWYFMHLRSEKVALMLMVGVPLLLMVDLLIGLMPDIGHHIFK